MTPAAQRPVLVLGGGINGAATARELALNGISVVLVDSADVASGATAYSSRLIHGGLRYLEYGEFDLVRESLAERTRLLRLAPHLVKPLRLFIPVKNRWGGAWSSAARFLGLPVGKPPRQGRGLYLVRAGLWFYDRYARDRTLPPRSVQRLSSAGSPRMSPSAGRWVCAYSDAQVDYPERLTVELLLDAQLAAAERGVDFQIYTYHRATLRAKAVELRPTGANADPVCSLEPTAIVNATGAWIDETLARLPVVSKRLIGGTKGSHFVTWHAGLKETLGGNGIYAEAPDGRPVFILPHGAGTLVGTTDIPFTGDPANAAVTEEELEYLLGVVNGLVADVNLTRNDVGFHYSGVRPLPFVDARTPAAITRRHAIVWNEASSIPLVSLVGGKLTTARSLAEEATDSILGRLNRKRDATSRERPLPGVNDSRLQHRATLSAAVEVIQTEWVARLEDLVERRLMLLYNPQFQREDLLALAHQLVAAGKLPPDELEAAVASSLDRLQRHYGRELCADKTHQPSKLDDHQ